MAARDQDPDSDCEFCGGKNGKGGHEQTPGFKPIECKECGKIYSAINGSLLEWDGKCCQGEASTPNHYDFCESCNLIAATFERPT